jgi:xylan 1,4-beta-xylosidase
VEEFLIDDGHSNAFTVWKQMGSPQELSPEQEARLKAAGQLELARSPQWVKAEGGRITVDMKLPRESVELMRMSW